MARMYEAAWNKLKTDKELRIRAHPKLHARIRKAIGKEKYYDVAYKLECSELQGEKYPVLEVSIDPENDHILVFTLKREITLKEL